MWENKDQKNSEYWYFPGSGIYSCQNYYNDHYSLPYSFPKSNKNKNPTASQNQNFFQKARRINSIGIGKSVSAL